MCDFPDDDHCLYHIVNIRYPKPITIIDLARTIRDDLAELSQGRLSPPVEVVDKGLPPLLKESDVWAFTVSVSRVSELLAITHLNPPDVTIRRIIQERLAQRAS